MDANTFSLLISGSVIVKISVFLTLLSILAINPFLSLIAYISCLTLNPQTFSFLLAQICFARIVALLALFFALFKTSGDSISRIFKIKQSKILLFVLFLILVCLFLGIGWRFTVSQVFEQMGKNVILYFLLLMVLINKPRLRFFVWAWLIFLGILAINTMYTYRIVGPELAEQMRLGAYDNSFFGGAGDFAVMMNVAFAMAFFMFMGERNIFIKLFFLSLSIAFVAAMVVTYARGGGIIAFLGTIIFIVFLGLTSKKIFQKIICLVLPILLLGAIVAYSPSTFINRMNTIKDYDSGTGGLRIEYWKLGIKMFLNNPILGVGPGNYPAQYHNYGGWEPIERVPHNMYIEAASEMGICGIASLILLLGLTFKEFFTSKRILESKTKNYDIAYFVSQGATAALVAYCVGGMFQSIFTYPFLYLLIGLVIASNNLMNKEICPK